MVLEEETATQWAALHLSVRLGPPPLVASCASCCWLRTALFSGALPWAEGVACFTL